MLEVGNARDLVDIHCGDDSGIADLFAGKRIFQNYLSPFAVNRPTVGQNGQRRFQTGDFDIGFRGCPTETVIGKRSGRRVPKFDNESNIKAANNL